MLGVLNTDGATPTLPKASPSTHILQVSDGSNGTDFSRPRAARDENVVTTLLATDANGTIIPLYVNSSGQLLIDSGAANFYYLLEDGTSYYLLEDGVSKYLLES